MLLFIVVSLKEVEAKVASLVVSVGDKIQGNKEEIGKKQTS